MKAWLTKAGPYRIERMEMPHSTTRVDLTRARAGVMHTIQGSLNSGIQVFRQHYAPTFGVGAHRLVQFVPLGLMDAALENHYGGAETNRWAVVQIEVEGFSQATPYQFPPAVLDPLAALMAVLVDEAGIPLRRPYPDPLPGGGPNVWARENFARRRDGKWGRTAGWFGHIEIPENSHWDPGNLRWAPLLKMAQNHRAKPTPKPDPPPSKRHRAFSIDLTDKDGSLLFEEAGRAGAVRRFSQFIPGGKYHEITFRRGPKPE